MQIDKELEQFRAIMEVPSSFEEGFRWSSLLGAIFVALLMVPGGIYMGLLAGTAEITSAAQWVTVILFIEVAKRAHRHLNKAEIFVLFYMAGAAMGLPFSGLLWNQFYRQSDAAIASGIAEHMPRWFAPAPEGAASYADRTFFHAEWLPVLGIMVFQSFMSQLANMVLGYGLFRVASDIERLPFPMAPIGAQGILALAEDTEARDDKEAQASWRWRVFSIGGAIGLAFGFVYLLLPAVSGALTGTTIQILPIPFSDFTPVTGQYLRAVATGLSWDFGHLIFGMVMPFFGMLGSFVGLLVTIVANPLLYDAGILRSWRFGDETVPTMFKNNVDFYFSFQIGIALAIAVAGIVAVILSIRRVRRDRAGVRLTDATAPPRKVDRGDIPNGVVLAVYLLVTLSYIGVSAALLRWHHGEWTRGIRNVILVLFGLGFVYSPLISYVTARLEGMVGQVVEIPFIREAALILSGYRGVACWFLPIPMANYGNMVVQYRQTELTGTRFTSIWKTTFFLYPIILISSIFFMNFIWSLAPVPSAAYPFAQTIWPLRAANDSIMHSATLGEYSIFEQAFRWRYLALGTVFGGTLFGVTRVLGAPVTLTYGLVRGLGQTMPHAIIPQFIGALIGRYYFQRRLGLRWRQYIPVVAAGFGCGIGLITTVGVGVTFLNRAIIQLAY